MTAPKETAMEAQKAADRIARALGAGPTPAAIGEIWHRVDGEWIDDGSETYQGMELSWTTWRCTKTTPNGAWFNCTKWRAKPKRFALTNGAKGLSRTDHEALERLIARKRRQIAILDGQKTTAEDTLEIARATLSAMNSARAALNKDS